MLLFAIAYAVYIFCFVSCVILLIRNTRVHEYRCGILEKISTKADFLIKNGKEWRYLYEYLDTVSYSEMVLEFWKPLDSFYDQSKFNLSLDELQ